MTFKKTRKSKKQKFTLEKSKTNLKQIVKNKKTNTRPQSFKSYASNNYYIDHPYFNIIFEGTRNINIECPELLEDIPHTFSFPQQENAGNVRFSTLLKKVDETMFKTIYTFT